MTISLSDSLSLRRRAIRHFEGLAAWWLREEAYDEVDQYVRPSLPENLGFCPILLVTKGGTKDSVLRPSVICPVRWVQGESDALSHRPLPQSLTSLANEIRDRLFEERQSLKLDNDDGKARWERLPEWRLVPGVKYFPDLSAVEKDFFTWDSAALPLAASLLLAAVDGKPPHPSVFGSGAVSRTGEILSVEGIAKKAAAVAKWGGKYFFLPENNFDDSEQKQLEELNKIKIISVKNQYRTLTDNIQTYRSALEGEPPEEASEDDIESYYMKIPAPIDNRIFYRKRIKPILVKRFQTQSQFDRLISWVSYGAELIELGAEVFRPKTITLFYTNTFENTLKTIVRIFPSDDLLKIEQEQIQGPLTHDALLAKVRNIFRRIPTNEKVLIDLTLGRVPMTMAFYENAPKNASFLYWLKENDDKTNKVKPLTTKPEIWQKGGER